MLNVLCYSIDGFTFFYLTQRLKFFFYLKMDSVAIAETYDLF